ncbi:MAG TPA: hypothetical protein PLN12_15395 [Flavobacteriales bacterium]|jgi:hypothetical protein|nr:hypothetical protein [Flavobacteriales bacterium]
MVLSLYDRTQQHASQNKSPLGRFSFHAFDFALGIYSLFFNEHIGSYVELGAAKSVVQGGLAVKF